jgi:CRP/FNR family transcriptional regulator
VPAGGFLFREGAPREAPYRVERGALLHTQRWEDGRIEIIEFAFPGDIIGLGHLPAHITRASAVMASEVRKVSCEELEAALAEDPRLALRLAAADDREFQAQRTRALRAAKIAPPALRLATYLSAVATIERSEGRPAPRVSREEVSAWALGTIGTSPEALAAALSELEARHLIRAAGGVIELADPVGLEAFAAAA